MREPFLWRAFHGSNRRSRFIKLTGASVAKSLLHKSRFLLGRLRLLSGDEVCRNGFVAVLQRGEPP